MRRVAYVAGVAAVLLTLTGAPALAAPGAETLVTVGSPTGPFSQNKQNEPAVAVDANHPNVLAAGANDEIDMEACNAGTDNTCPFTPGVGVSGVYFSSDSGHSWHQPTYTGLTARNCLGAPGDTDPACTPTVGPIGTLPWYTENGLVSDGDPGVAFGPQPGPNGFSWSNGSRLYYSNLAATTTGAFKGFEAIAVSRTDNVQAAAAGTKSAWMPPVIVSRQSNTTFSDKEQIWADNAASSPFFGTVYLCWASFRGQEKGNAAPAPLVVAVSHDGGTTWTQHQVTAAANNSQRNPLDGCTVRTDSHGTAYVFGVGTVSSAGHDAFELMVRSTDGGHTWTRPAAVAGPVTQPGVLDPVQGRPVIDGIAGARSDLAPAPSVDIANGAPTGSDATNRIVMTYVSGALAQPHVYFTESTNGGAAWSTPRAIESSGDRGLYTAPAISPNGTTVYVVYNAFTTPFRNNTTDPRSLVGVVLQASVGASGPTGAFGEIHRGAPGDPRGSSANALTDEFLGDYVYAAATRTYGVAVWNDTRNAGVCGAINSYRQALQSGQSATPPAVEQQCPLNFGNSDIYSFTTG
ncbi:MAG TPA: sialidase family protein [Streptosporangiaceae bacterium]|nr:sialidase family protein [Streptosporangiaceae bacterium]